MRRSATFKVDERQLLQARRLRAALIQVARDATVLQDRYAAEGGTDAYNKELQALNDRLFNLEDDVLCLTGRTAVRENDEIKL